MTLSRPLRLTADHVALTLRDMPKEAPPEGWTPLDEAGVAAAADRLLEAKPPGPLMVFGYGSLLWKPGFEVAGRHRAVAPGWHRQFCIELTGWRGSPEAPGLMLALQSGGSCAGILLEAAKDATVATTRALILRETPYVEMLGEARWIDTVTATGRQRALVFYAGTRGPRIRRGRPLEAQAKLIARACGPAGSSAEYLFNTVRSLDEHGIHDRNLWRLQELVADEIEALLPPAPRRASAG